tara:strand:+ start:86 stop:259 length:174 start_codon:yes stop_codon:yes gene_type:complete
MDKQWLPEAESHHNAVIYHLGLKLSYGWLAGATGRCYSLIDYLVRARRKKPQWHNFN